MKTITENMKLPTKDKIRERIIELNYFLIQFINSDDKSKVDAIRIETNSLIKLYLKD